jgi:hypothetical protein
VPKQRGHTYETFVELVIMVSGKQVLGGLNALFLRNGVNAVVWNSQEKGENQSSFKYLMGISLIPYAKYLAFSVLSIRHNI